MAMMDAVHVGWLVGLSAGGHPALSMHGSTLMMALPY